MKSKSAVITRSFLLLCVCLTIPFSLFAADFSGRLSSVVSYYQSFYNYDDSMPVYLYGMLNVKDITEEGLSFKSYARAADDVKNQQQKQSKLYYAYLEQKNIFGSVDFKLGRNYVFTPAGSPLVDGLELKYRPFRSFNVKLFGGGDVKLNDEYDEDDQVAGLEIYGDLASFSYSVAYLNKWDEKALTKDLAGLELSYNHQNLIRLYTDLQYNLLSENFSYALTGAGFYQPKWDITVEYLYSLPVFESTSIYSVFAVEEYEELFTRLRYKLDNGIYTYASFTNEYYDEYPDAYVYELGINKIRTDKFQGYLTGVYRDDSGDENRVGIKSYMSYFFHRYAVTGIGLNYDVLEKSQDDADDTTYERVWVDVTSYLNKSINLEFKVERVASNLYDDYFTGTARINYSF